MYRVPNARAPTSKGYLLFMMAAFYAVSIIDRSVLNILAQPIKTDLRLTDAQLGVLGGLAFGVLYAGLGIPMARLAEKRARIDIISIALLVWSTATVACGFASNFVQLAAGRVGVGIGEAACTPCAQSLIADSYPPKQRTTAMSIYSTAIPVGTVIGTLAGALIGTHYGWRSAFFILGLPGIVLAAMARMTIREPSRGMYEVQHSDRAPSYRTVLAHILGKRTFVHMGLGFLLTSIAASGAAVFNPAFMLRAPFRLHLNGVAIVQTTTSVAMMVGIVASGVLSDRLSKRQPRIQMLLPASSLLFTAAFLIASFLQTQVSLFVVLQVLAFLGLVAYIGPTFGALHNMVESRMRASAVATINLLTNLVGGGIGPLLVGWLSDHFAAYSYIGAGAFHSDCEAATHDALCQTASFQGLRDALILMALLHAWAAFHYFLASRTVERDLAPKTQPSDGPANIAAPISN